ncbi:MBL fold metallo-hydrolase [Entomospira nematocerorum]|uniref:MBL fold metallo-hydrolase n=1 Tax=Entomospira nematocerorum TaxID=2719987 RepID=A0A968GGP2_9SPIO|nr:MBL fold metallo-hydrolase [Entomospira nematocera]NIZ47501.1 MBL fold metallo-hydrolase [Entomospira nematocera]WDI33959.1 MBL fold metallo-hydrolase [Entomospira nematocera]
MMTVTFLGTGTSDGVPLIACSCTTCQSQSSKNRRLRASVLVQDGQSCVLIDASSDFREQALKYNIQKLDAILFTHADADHISGIPELRALNWSMKQTIDIYAQKHRHVPTQPGTLWGIDMIYHQYYYAFNNEAGKKGRPSLLYHPIILNQDIMVNSLIIEPLEIFHGSMPIVGFRIEDFAYITDASTIPEETIYRLANRNLDILVLNAVRLTPHPRHFHLDQAMEIAKMIGAKTTYFTHISHDIEHEKISAILPENMFLAYDGLIVQTRENTVISSSSKRK